MKKFSANYIFTSSGSMLKNGIVVTDDNGYVLDVIDTGGTLTEIEGLQFHSGVIVPGFVNCHCHIELSHLKDKIPQGQGLPDFLGRVISLRDTVLPNEADLIRADNYMFKTGTVAVGDVSNTERSFEVKWSSKIHYHTFIEAIGLNGSLADKRYKVARQVYKLGLEGGVFDSKTASIVPHSWYSVSDQLMELIKKTENQNLISIHNQETKSENTLFASRSGDLYDKMTSVGFNYDDVSARASTSLKARLTECKSDNNILLVHNTFSNDEDIAYAQSRCKYIFWVLCPKSNLYLENTLPPVARLMANNAVIALGTDSLASNKSLSVWDEICTIAVNFPNISFFEIVRWATINGAKALNISDKFGSIETGKQPGLNLISNFNFKEMKPTSLSSVTKLI